ncbi:MAG: mechanosensitive ion channel, partial [Gammaproteobacteria bacterium]|nr:mechanosensitive ion channel [Gammaproteobacteria bacterium]
IDIPVGVAYGSDPAQVQHLLLEAIADLPGLAASPGPVVHFQAFGASSLDFRLLLWTSDLDNRLAMESEARSRVLQALRQAGIEIPFTQMDIRVRRTGLPDEEPAAPPGAGAGPPVAP